MRIERHLVRADESLVREGGVSPLYYLVVALTCVVLCVVFAAVAALGFGTIQGVMGAVGGGLAVVDALRRLTMMALPALFLFAGCRESLRAYSYAYALTDRRLIVRHGVLSKHVRSAELDRTQDVSVSQDLVSRALGYGEVFVETAGTMGNLLLWRVDRPYEWADAVREQLAAERKRMVRDPWELHVPQNDPTQGAAYAVAPGWHPDPYRRHQARYWSGSSWTDHVMNNGCPGLDPLPT